MIGALPHFVAFQVGSEGCNYIYIYVCIHNDLGVPPFQETSNSITGLLGLYIYWLVVSTPLKNISQLG